MPSFNPRATSHLDSKQAAPDSRRFRGQTSADGRQPSIALAGRGARHHRESAPADAANGQTGLYVRSVLEDSADKRGYSPGTEVIDPYTKQPMRVP